MITSSESITRYWQRFQDSLPAGSPYLGKTYVAEGWGDSPALADELGALIASGVKTAACSSVWEWEARGESFPAPGYLTIVLDGQDEPLCIIETYEVTFSKFNEVDAALAYDEGEGDRTLAYWREAHRRYFTRTLPAYQRQFSEDMPLVCERFRRIDR